MNPFQWLTWIMMSRFLLLGEFPSALAKQPLVKIHDGLLRGNYERTFHGTIYSSFQGIPYASPPTENLRFAAPIPNKPWSDTLDVSTNCTIKCPQMDGTAMDWKSTEDCLYLSVYSPFLLRSPKDVPKRRDRAPVLVFFHGGGFTSGSGMYFFHGPNRFLDYEIVVVTMNFRLGPLGFFTTGTSEAPGNQALRDQNLALKWVQRNIKEFGGDPTQVTIFGESSGSWSVFYHMLSPKSTGLFHGVIGQSGTPLAPAWPNLTKAKAVRYGKVLISATGCKDAVDHLQCMRNLPVDVLIRATNTVDDQDDRMLILFAYNGMIDGEITNDPFLPRDPVEILEKGAYNKNVRVLLGVNRDEGLIIASNSILDHSYFDEWRMNWDHYGPLLLFGKEEREKTEQDVRLAFEVLKFYLKSEANVDRYHLDDLIHLFSDSSYWYGTHLWANYMLRDGIPTYQYMFSFKGKYSLLDFSRIDGRLYGVSHGDELFYLWHPFYFVQPDYGEPEECVGSQMIAMWINFATSGEPTPQGSGTVDWRPINLRDHSYLEINYHSEMRYSSEYRQRMLFWLNNIGLTNIRRMYNR